MVNTVRKNKFWLIAVFVVIAVCGTFVTWQTIYAQTPMATPVETPPPGTAASGGAAPVATGDMSATGGTGASTSGGAATATVPTEPEVGFGQVVHSGIAVSSKKCWDGQVFSSMKFKYKTVDGRMLTVVLPSEYKKEKRTRAGWETLFVCYAMDTEIAIDRIQAAMPPDVSRFMGELMSEIRGQAGGRPTQEVIAEVMQKKVRDLLPSMGLGNISLPPMLPGMP